MLTLFVTYRRSGKLWNPGCTTVGSQPRSLQPTGRGRAAVASGLYRSVGNHRSTMSADAISRLFTKVTFGGAQDSRRQTNVAESGADRKMAMMSNTGSLQLSIPTGVVVGLHGSI